MIFDENSVIPCKLPEACVQVWKLGPIPIITIQSSLIPPFRARHLCRFYQRSSESGIADANDKWTRKFFINVKNYDQRSLKRYWHSRLPLLSDNQNQRIANSWKIEDIIRWSWSKLEMKVSFTSCPKIPLTKKVLDLRPHLSCFPTHESIVYLWKGFIYQILKYVKFLCLGLYQRLGGLVTFIFFYNHKSRNHTFGAIVNLDYEWTVK